MNGENKNINFYHALQVNNDLCYGCTHCLIACPTKAIRISSGKAKINHKRCIDCGECVRVCPVNAIYVEQDDFNDIFNYKHRLAIVPSVFLGQFSLKLPISDIIKAIKSIGFTEVHFAEDCVELINQKMLDEYNAQEVRPLISSFCPAIVRLIQIKFPAMVDNIIPIKSPADTSALFYRNKLENSGIKSSDIGVFYVTPCAAKIADMKTDNHSGKQIINGIINMDTLYNKVFHVLDKQTESAKTPSNTKLLKKIIQWSLTNGEAKYMQGRCLAIDEVHNVIDFLEKVEDGEICNVKFLELRACDESCAGGVLMTENRFITKERINHIAEKLPVSDKRAFEEKQIQQISNEISCNKFEAFPVAKLDEDIEQAFLKMKKIRHLMCFLPGIDCGACGAPNCQTLAEDIVMKKAQLSNCVFIQRNMEKNYKLSADHSIRIIEKIWGDKRLEKNCNKKGAENETD